MKFEVISEEDDPLQAKDKASSEVVSHSIQNFSKKFWIDISLYGNNLKKKTFFFFDSF